MGIVELFLYIAVIVLGGGAAIWIMGKLVPNHPPIVDSIIWVLVVIFVALLVIQALGLHDFQVPRLR